MRPDDVAVSLDGPALTPRGRSRAREEEWLRVGHAVVGPLLTLAVAIAADLLARRGLVSLNPNPLLMATVAYAGLRGGLQPGLIIGVISLVYAAHFFAEPGQPFHYTLERGLGFAAVALAAPAIAVLAARHRAGDGAAEEPAMRRLRARRALQHDVTTRLLMTTEVVATLQSVARTCVPLLGHWCLIQLARAEGGVRAAGVAHPRPDREEKLRALAGQGWPFERAEAGPLAPRTLDAAALGLGAGSVLTVPLVAGGRRIGRLVLGREGADAAPYDDDEISDAVELALGVALAVAHAELARERGEAEATVRSLFAGNPQPMWIFDVESLAFLDVNDAAVRAYGYSREEFLSLTLMDLRPEGDTASPAHLFDRGAPQRPGVAITRHRRRDGSVLDVELASHELDFQGARARLVLATDISDRARAAAALHESEEQLRRAQRGEMLGRLAGGLAHDFNNMLTAIQGYSELLIQDLDPHDERRHDLEEIRHAAARGGLLTRQLIGFDGRATAGSRPVDLNALVADLESLVRHLVGSDIQLAAVLAPALGPVLADPALLEQVLLTLIIAARDAMPGGGTLALETSEREVGAGAKGQLLAPGRYVVLAVTDTGADLTRRPTPDAALGMSIAYGIVRELGGVLRVLSQPDSGTTVKVYLPRHDAEVPADQEDAAMPPIGRETVLLVEDEEGVRHVLRKVLVRHGYTVIEARHGRDALREAERHEGPIHLLVTDMVMPEMGGAELAAELERRRSGLRTIFISGYTPDEIARRGLAQPGVELLTKPFPSDEFIQRVRLVLDAVAA